MRLDHSGKPLFEAPGTPRLMALMPDGGTLVFARPGAETPNELQLASVR